jgi:hypothetical protein
VDEEVEAMTRHPCDDAVLHASRGVRQPAPARRGLLGRGVRLFEGIDRDVVGLRRMRVRSGAKATHLQDRVDAGRVSADARGLGRCLGT